MKIKPRPRAEVEAYWRERATEDRRPPRESRNVGPVLFLTDPMRLPFRGLMYEIPPVPYKVGLQVVELQNEIFRAAEASDFAGYRALLHDVVKLVRANVKLYRARAWWRFWWALGWNPFTRATEMELGEFLAGFLMRRTMPHK
jgi:hypothetical protein